MPLPKGFHRINALNSELYQIFMNLSSKRHHIKRKKCIQIYQNKKFTGKKYVVWQQPYVILRAARDTLIGFFLWTNNTKKKVNLELVTCDTRSLDEHILIYFSFVFYGHRKYLWIKSVREKTAQITMISQKIIIWREAKKRIFIHIQTVDYISAI